MTIFVCFENSQCLDKGKSLSVGHRLIKEGPVFDYCLFLGLQYVEEEVAVPEEEVVPEEEHFIAHVPVPSQKEVSLLSMAT